MRAPGAQIIVVGTHLDVFRRSEGRNTENLLEEYRKRILEEFTSQDRTFPKIRKVVFVGLNEATGFFGTTTKYDDLNDIIHEEASNMEIPKSNDMFDQSFCPFCVISPGHNPHVSICFISLSIRLGQLYRIHCVSHDFGLPILSHWQNTVLTAIK